MIFLLYFCVADDATLTFTDDGGNDGVIQQAELAVTGTPVNIRGPRGWTRGQMPSVFFCAPARCPEVDFLYIDPRLDTSKFNMGSCGSTVDKPGKGMQGCLGQNSAADSSTGAYGVCGDETKPAKCSFGVNYHCFTVAGGTNGNCASVTTNDQGACTTTASTANGVTGYENRCSWDSLPMKCSANSCLKGVLTEGSCFEKQYCSSFDVANCPAGSSLVTQHEPSFECNGATCTT